MVIYQGIQLVYAHVVQLLNGIQSWFTGIEWDAITSLLPINFIPYVSGFLIILIAMACVGIVKKLSFLLG